MENTNTINKLETMINAYQAKKEELKIETASILQPMWAEIVEIQTAAKAERDAEKKAARIAMLEEELAKLKS